MGAPGPFAAKAAFQWKTADDVLHVVIGLVLVGVGVMTDRALSVLHKA